jgi:hypothetical protein
MKIPAAPPPAARHPRASRASTVPKGDTMSNRVTLAQLDQMPIGEIANLPVAQLAMLLEDVAELKARAKRLGDWTDGALNLRYGEAAALARRADGKDTGRVRIEDEDFVVVADLPKKVTWSQPELREAMLVIAGWGEDVGDYVQTEIKVSEAKFEAWPKSIKALFEPARTMGVGKPSFAIEARKREAA